MNKNKNGGHWYWQTWRLSSAVGSALSIIGVQLRWLKRIFKRLEKSNERKDSTKVNDKKDNDKRIDGRIFGENENKSKSWC